MLSKVRNCHYVIPDPYSSALILLLTEVRTLPLNIPHLCVTFIDLCSFRFLLGGAASL